MAAAYPIPSFLQLPIDGVVDEAESQERPRPRDAALARGGSLRLTHPVRIAPGAIDGDEAGPTGPERSPAESPATGSRPALAAAPSAIVAESAIATGSGPVRESAGGFDRSAAIATWRAWLQAWEIDADPAPVIDALVERLGDPRRHFHDLERVAAELARLDEWRDVAQDPVAVGFATWFRYAILDSARFDNEARSAEFARIGLAGLGLDTNRIRLVRELIVSTREGAVVGSPDARLLADIGRARLADAADVFDQHEDALRAESVHVVDLIYWRRRLAVMRAMLIKPRIYLTDRARDRLEAAARDNLSRRLAAR